MMKKFFGIITLVCLILTGCSTSTSQTSTNSAQSPTTTTTVTTHESIETTSPAETTSAESSTSDSAVSDNTGTLTVSQGTSSFTITVPEYTGSPYTVVNDNEPFFTKDDMTTDSYEFYSELDSLERCGYTMSCIGQDIMPTEDRGNIGSVKPSGWHTVKYDCVDGKYLYNRCHLIGFQLTGENANEQNLITGTRYLNVDGMLPFENMVADYVKESQNHVLYRVTPIFIKDNLVASGVLMEAKSVEDDGEGILFCVYCYNVQPGVVIDYVTGFSHSDDETTAPSEEATVDINKKEYVLNTKSLKFHYPDCSGVKNMSEENKKNYVGTKDELISKGYEACGICKP